MRSVIGRALSAHFYHRPIFQVGASRSGTIVLYKALGTHPAILSMPSEDPFVTYVAGAVVPFEAGPETDYFRESVRIDRPYLYRQLRRLCFESAAGLQFGFKTLAKALAKEGAGLLRKRFWCVKCFPLEEHAHALLTLYPEAKFVYIVRNGIDVVESRTKFPAFRDQPFEHHCEFWVQAARKFSYLSRFDRAVEVRQEELLADPAQVFARIAAHIGVPNDPSPARYVTTTLVHSRGDKATHTNVDVRKSLQERPPSYANWTVTQRETFKRVCGEAMDQLGYSVPF